MLSPETDQDDLSGSHLSGDRCAGLCQCVLSHQPAALQQVAVGVARNDFIAFVVRGGGSG